MPLLAERLRPTTTHPEHLVGPAGRIWRRELKQWLERSRFHAIFWGPPGTGKTTLAMMLGESAGLPMLTLSAVRDGVKEIRDAVSRNAGGLVFIDEIHRLTRTQQDVLLPILERSEAWILGATTESPAVALAPAILSRMRAIRVAPPSTSDLEVRLRSGLALLIQEAGGVMEVSAARMEELISQRIAPMSQGDVRFALNTLESVFHCANPEDQEEVLRNSLRAFTSKKHYDWVSAMIKSLRGSDPDAALFYAVTALDAGEDPLFILRRCIIFASEDVGNADPNALNIAVNAFRAMESVGLPEGAIPLAQCVTYLASTVKSNRAYLALHKVREWRKQILESTGGDPSPPRFLTKAGADEYRYPHDFEDAFVRAEYLPDPVAELRRAQGPAYLPSQRGAESRIVQRLSELWSRKR